MTDSGFPGEKVSVGDKLRKAGAIVVRVPAFSAYDGLERTAADQFSFETMFFAASHIFTAFCVYHHGQIAQGLLRGDDNLIS